MSEIRLEEGTINVDGEWFSVEDLARRIQEKMQSGDLKLTKFAAALETLKTALEKAHTIEVKLVLTTDEYEKLKALGGETDSECLRRAVSHYINAGPPPPDPRETPETQNAPSFTIQCPHPQCMTAIVVETDQRPLVVECPNCGLSGRLTEENKWDKL